MSSLHSDLPMQAASLSFFIRTLTHLAIFSKQPVSYTVRVRTKCEAFSSFLAQKGLGSFAPTYDLRRKYSTKRVEAALSPSEVFCRVNRCTQFPVLSPPSIQSIVGCGDGPHSVYDYEIEELRRALFARAQSTPRSWPFNRRRVRSGAHGCLVSLNKHQHRIVLCADLLQNTAAIELNLGEVEPAT